MRRRDPRINSILHIYQHDSNEEEQYQHDLDIEVVPHENPHPDLAPITNHCPKPKWAQNLIEAIANGPRNPHDKRITQSQYQNEHVALSHTTSLSIEWCNKLPCKCYLMIENDQQFGPPKNKIDHSIPPPKRRNTKNINQIRRKLRVSHAQSQDAAARRTKLVHCWCIVLQIAANFLRVITQRGKFSLRYSFFS